MGGTFRLPTAPLATAVLLVWGLGGCGEALTEAASSGTGDPASTSSGGALETDATPSPSGGPAGSAGASSSTTSPVGPTASDSGGSSGPPDPRGATTTDGGESRGDGSAGTDESTGSLPVTCEQLFIAESPPPVCSEAGDAAAVTVANECVSISIEVWWSGYGPACVEEYNVVTINPGQSALINTAVTHPFRIRNAATGDLMVEVPPTPPGASMFTVP